MHSTMETRNPSYRVSSGTPSPCTYVWMPSGRFTPPPPPVAAFQGCIYKKPVINPVDARVVDLTRDELLAHKDRRPGLPMRVEHKDYDVGRVISASVDSATGQCDIEFEIYTDDMGAGTACGHLIDTERVNELSLKHRIYPGRSKFEFIEVGCLPPPPPAPPPSFPFTPSPRRYTGFALRGGCPP